MSFAVQIEYGEVAVTISTDSDYSGMVAEDMANIARRAMLRTDADIAVEQAVEMTLAEARALDGEDT